MVADRSSIIPHFLVSPIAKPVVHFEVMPSNHKTRSTIRDENGNGNVRKYCHLRSFVVYSNRDASKAHRLVLDLIAVLRTFLTG